MESSAALPERQSDYGPAMHDLQTLFATQEGEQAWEAEMRRSFHEGDLENLRKYLALSLETLETRWRSSASRPIRAASSSKAGTT